MSRVEMTGWMTSSNVYSDILDGGSGRLHCQLVVVDGPDRGRACRLAEREVVIGTDPKCDLVLSDDRVSGRHLALTAVESRFAVRDLESTNGTFYEGSRITEVTVPAGSTLLVARTPVRIEPEAQPLDIPPSQARRFGELVGESLAMREVFAVLERIAGADATVLVEGETGTGKELVSRAVHDASPRRRGPFVAVDCGALPENLLESELFGHVRGAFTGASNARSGMIARADGGTLFLDELGRVSPTLQARLLRVLEERAVRPLGGDSERAVDVRVIAASRDDLDAEVAAGRFRPDLLYRLAVVRIKTATVAHASRRHPVARASCFAIGSADEAPAGGTSIA
jgi:transcriptional regulator of acetoin/glycerol metabolism